MKSLFIFLEAQVAISILLIAMAVLNDKGLFTWIGLFASSWIIVSARWFLFYYKQFNQNFWRRN
jgi:hypothetical protein